jgi:hypothetical protein
MSSLIVPLNESELLMEIYSGGIPSPKYVTTKEVESAKQISEPQSPIVQPKI